MAIPAEMLPSRCCCCTLQTGSIVVGALGMILALVFMALAIPASWSYDGRYCRHENHSYGEEVCSSYNKFASNLMAFVSTWNALEVMACVGLIWGATKSIPAWVTTWLVISVGWIVLHIATVIAALFAIPDTAAIVVISVFGIFLLAMSLLSVLTVAGLRNELVCPRLYPPNGIVPAPQYSAPPPVANFTGYQTWYPPPQQPIVYTTITAPPLVAESAPA